MTPYENVSLSQTCVFHWFVMIPQFNSVFSHLLNTLWPGTSSTDPGPQDGLYLLCDGRHAQLQDGQYEHVEGGEVGSVQGAPDKQTDEVGADTTLEQLVSQSWHWSWHLTRRRGDLVPSPTSPQSYSRLTQFGAQCVPRSSLTIGNSGQNVSLIGAWENFTDNNPEHRKELNIA